MDDTPRSIDNFTQVGGNTVIAKSPQDLLRHLTALRVARGNQEESLRYWFRRDTWSPSEAMMLLLGLDPRGTKIEPSAHWRDDRHQALLEFSCLNYLDGRLVPFIYWTALFEQDVVPQNLAKDVRREVWNLSERYRAMSSLWESGTHPEHNTPGYYLRWALSKDFSVDWFDWAQRNGHVASEEPEPNPSTTHGSPAPFDDHLADSAISSPKDSGPSMVNLADAPRAVLAIVQQPKTGEQVQDYLHDRKWAQRLIDAMRKGNLVSRGVDGFPVEYSDEQAAMLYLDIEDIRRWLATNGVADAALDAMRVTTPDQGHSVTQTRRDAIPVAQTPDDAATADTSAPPAANKPLPRQQYQEDEILRVIRELGEDPKALPKQKAGTKGIKSAVRAKLTSPDWTESIFTKAWERLLGNDDIAYVQ